MNEPKTTFPVYLRPFLLMISLLLISILVVLLVQMPPTDALPKKAAALMSEIDQLETSLTQLTDTVESKSLMLKERDEWLVDKYLELELMIHWVRRLEEEGKVKSDSISLLKEKLESVRLYLMSERVSVTSEKLINYDLLANENDSLRKLLDSVLALQDEPSREKISSPFKVQDYQFVNVRANGKEDEGERFKRKSVERINVCFKLKANPMAQTGQQTIYLVCENPDGSIRNTANNPKVYQEGKAFDYTNLAIVDYDGSDKEVCIPIFENEDELYQSGPQYVYIYHNGEVIGRGYFEVE